MNGDSSSRTRTSGSPLASKWPTAANLLYYLLVTAIFLAAFFSFFSLALPFFLYDSAGREGVSLLCGLHLTTAHSRPPRPPRSRCAHSRAGRCSSRGQRACVVGCARVVRTRQSGPLDALDAAWRVPLATCVLPPLLPPCLVCDCCVVDLPELIVIFCLCRFLFALHYF